MDVKDLTTVKIKDLLQQSYYHSLWHKQVSPHSFNSFIVQRCKMAVNFEGLLRVGIQAATKIGAKKLAKEFAINLADERGVDEFGHRNPTTAHKHWRNNFLDRLQLTTYDDIQIELPSVKAHRQYLQELEQEANAFKIAGAILLIERFVPMEFRAIKASRDHLFPQLFVINDGDTDLEAKQKMDACRYVDDHIIHDAKEHYPNLLEAIQSSVKNDKNRAELQSGIEEMSAFRLKIFHEVNTALH